MKFFKSPTVIYLRKWKLLLFITIALILTISSNAEYDEPYIKELLSTAQGTMIFKTLVFFMYLYFLYVLNFISGILMAIIEKTFYND